MKSKLLLIAAIAVGGVAGASIQQARADGDSDTHRISLALDRQTAALEKISRSLERMAERR